MKTEISLFAPMQGVKPMIKRINYTGRRRINKDDVSINVHQNGNAAATVSAQVSLVRYRFPATARIFVEAFRQTSLMRFEWGTVSEPIAPPDCALTDFQQTEGVRFRVKVVEEETIVGTNARRLLAVADRLSPHVLEETQSQAESLLPLVSADIPEVWRVDFPADGGEPVLEVNRELVPNPSALGRSEHFVSLVLPTVLRIVLTHVLLVEQYDGCDEGEDWRALWLRMARSCIGAGRVPEMSRSNSGQMTNQADIEEWIETVVEMFARRFEVTTRFGEWWREGENS